MAKKYIVAGKIYEDNGSDAVVVGNVIVVQTGSGGSPPATFNPAWALGSESVIGGPVFA